MRRRPGSSSPTSCSGRCARALPPGALAYARARRQTAAAQPVAVLVHAYVAGDAHGHAAGDGGQPILATRIGSPSAQARATIEAAVLDLARRHGPVELEWVAT